jgi:HTH-type transcriptional regulator, competence development regulator
MTDELLVQVGKRISRLRKRRGWTQVILAEHTGLDRSFLADVERGKRNISILNLYLVAKGLDISLSRLLSGL